MLQVERIPSIRVMNIPDNVTWIYEKPLIDTKEFQNKNSSIDQTYYYGYADLRTRVVSAIMS